MEKKIIDRVYELILNRKNNPVEKSYTCHLFNRGKEEILQKIAEESDEVVQASLRETPERIISELADLHYHLLVLMAEEGIQPEDVYRELEKRFKKKEAKD
jgi:phosphoribosyl-ATP pyrophosphohydrolase